MQIKTLLLTVILLLAGIPSSFAQKAPAVEVPMEKVYLHTSTALLFPGDYLYYKAYVREAKSKNLSDLSKVAYVVLVDSEGTVHFEHKLFLEKGMGYGDYFVRENLESGMYKLLAYTHWMKNAGEPAFFQTDIAIINPYTNNQSEVLGEASQIMSSPSTSSTSASTDLIVPQKAFASREKVNFSLEFKDEDAKQGHYSVSVYRKNPFSLKAIATATEDEQKNSFAQPKTLSADSFLPELRGELVQARVLDEASNPVSDVSVAFSALGQDEHFDIAQTNDDGTFYVNLAQDYETTPIFMEPITEAAYTVEFVPKTRVDVTQLDFPEFKFDETVKDFILQKSIHNQLENAYAGAKPDSIVPADKAESLKSLEDVNYQLDDYTRFPTLRETIREVVTVVGVRDKQAFVWTDRSLAFENLPALVLVDGAFVKDHSLLWDLDARKIKEISVVRKNLMFNAKTFRGAVLITTEEMDFQAIQLVGKRNYASFLPAPQKQKTYFFTDHSQAQNQKLPDFRYQLLWKPVLEVGNSTKDMFFYTSDVAGTFEIRLEGFTKSGKPVSLRSEIEVK
ncbi:MAG: Ig-like domain-containing protein [Bacteroidota bacterium]